MSHVHVTHAGTVAFRNGAYERVSGTANWKVWPIEAFDPPQRVPVGQVQIDFAEPVRQHYSVVVSARRIASAPLISANYGNATESGFVVHLWETIADRTLQNGDFSFAVYQFDGIDDSPAGPTPAERALEPSKIATIMDLKELLTIELDSGEAILVKAAEELTEEEFNVHLPGPGPSANWIFGHLAVNEDWFLSILTPQKMLSSNELIERYQGDLSFAQEVAHKAARPQPEMHSKQDVVDLFISARQRTLAAMREADVSSWNDPLPAGIPFVYKNVGGIWGIIAVHQYWHLGQLMSIRHMLRKPPVDL